MTTPITPHRSGRRAQRTIARAADAESPKAFGKRMHAYWRAWRPG